VQVGAQDRLELLEGHLNEQAIEGRAGIVDEDRDWTHVALNLREELCDVLFFADIAREGARPPAERRDAVARLLGARGIRSIVDGDVCAHTCQPQRRGAPDAATAARH
jgi:hypothetical protein